MAPDDHAPAHDGHSRPDQVFAAEPFVPSRKAAPHARAPRGGQGRFFDRPSLGSLILHCISTTPRHGYEIITLIESQSGGAHAPSPGIVYPTLTKLEAMGLAAVPVEGTRKRYRITEQGRRDLADKHALVEAMMMRMRLAGERRSHERPLPIMRAMENLRMVLHLHATDRAGPRMDAVTDILDEAAKAIERLPVGR